VLVAALIGALSDIIAGRVPYLWILVNYHFNIMQNRAAMFGTDGPLLYADLLLFHLGPVTILIAVGAVLSPGRYRPLLWALLTNLVFHSMIAHKEYRFVWISVVSLLVLAAITSVTVAERALAQRGRVLGQTGLAALALMWLGCGWVANANSGGARALRTGAPFALAGLDGARRSQTCGIALPNQWRAHLVPAMLPRAVPLYTFPSAVLESDESLPREIIDSANVLIFSKRPRGAEAYTRLSCHANFLIRVCAYVRPGPCHGDSARTYQSKLEQEGL